MRQRLFGLAAAIAIATAATAAAQSEYRKLDDAFDRYQPPTHLFRPPAPAQPAAPAGSEAYAAEKQRLLERQASWRDEVDDLSAPTAFYRPHAEVLGRLQESRQRRRGGATGRARGIRAARQRGARAAALAGRRGSAKEDARGDREIQPGHCA